MTGVMRRAPGTSGSAKPGFPWALAVLSSVGLAATYLILPEFAPRTVSTNQGVFLLGVCLGLAVGIAVRVPRRLIPVLGAVSALAVLAQLLGDAVPLWPAAGVAVLVGIELSALAVALRWRGIARLRRPVDVVLLGGFAVVVALGCGVVAVLVLHAWGGLGAESVAHDVRAWVLGDVFGVVCVAPAVFTAHRPSSWSWTHAPEFASAAVVTALMTYFLFWRTTGPTPGLLGWPYLVMLGPLWIAVRLGVRAVAPVIAIVMWLAAVGTVNGYGAFADAAPLAHDQLVTVQIFAVIVAIVLLLLGVLRDDRLRALTDEVAAVRALSESEALSRVVLDSTSEAIMQFGPDLRAKYVNKRLVELTGITPEDWKGKTFAEAGYPPHLSIPWDEYSRRVFATGEPVLHEFELDLPVGHRWFETRVDPVFAADGSVTDVVTTSRDVTERRRAEEELRDSEALLTVILEGSQDATTTFGRDMRFEYVNRRVVELSGIPVEAWIGRSMEELGYPQDAVDFWKPRIRAVFDKGEPGTMQYDLDNAEGHRWYEAVLSPQFGPDGSVAHVISTNRDITERVLAEQALRELATHDALTTLANRTAIQDEIERSLRAGLRSGGSTAVLMVDLDRFQRVNDSLGHDIGDELLREAGVRIAGAVRGGDLVGRMGGDEFCVVMRDLEDPSEAVTAAWRLVTDFRAGFLIGGEELFATASIGVAVAAGHSDAQALLREADTALFVAKGEGRDRVSVFNEELRDTVTTRIRLEGDLRHALERGQLAVWYQPEIDLNTGAMIAVEALLRWHHPSGETYTADRFVELAEETGLILDIGPWVLQQACAQAQAWAQSRPDRSLTVRVNASALQLADAGLLPSLDGALAASGLDPGLLCIEITETALLRETQTARDNLDGIRHRGIRIAVDDFGTGYASLAYLRQYPVDVLKIDRSFVTEITTNDYDRRLVAGIVSLSESLGMTVTAEGVETPEQAALLRVMGCPGAQGYLYSRAVPADTITAHLDTQYPHP